MNKDLVCMHRFWFSNIVCQILHVTLTSAAITVAVCILCEDLPQIATSIVVTQDWHVMLKAVVSLCYFTIMSMANFYTVSG